EWRADKADAHTRPPSDHEAEHVLVRTAECVYGKVDVELSCAPAFGYATREPDWAMAGDEHRAADVTDGDVKLRLTSDVKLGIEGSEVRARHTVGEGDKCFCALAWGSALSGPGTTEDADKSLARTCDFWRAWIGGGKFPDHPWGL